MKILHAQSKPKRIEVVLVESVHSHDSMRHDNEGVIRVFNRPQNTWIQVNIGDYLRVDNLDDIYPIAPDYFEKNYDLIETVS